MLSLTTMAAAVVGPAGAVAARAVCDVATAVWPAAASLLALVAAAALAVLSAALPASLLCLRLLLLLLPLLLLLLLLKRPPAERILPEVSTALQGQLSSCNDLYVCPASKNVIVS
jgi:hypothetical protein